MASNDNFTTYEYLESFRERANQIANCTKDLIFHLDNVNTGGFLTNFVKDCKSILESIFFEIQNLIQQSESENFSVMEKLENTFIWQNSLDSYSRGLSILEKAIGQRLIAANYDEHFFPDYNFGAYYPRIVNSLDSLLRRLVPMFFPVSLFRNSRKGSGYPASIKYLTIFGDTPSYEVNILDLLYLYERDTILFVANVPRIDAYRYRFLTCFCHEISHVKLKYSCQSSEYDDSLLFFEYPIEGQKLYDHLVKKMGWDIGDVYKKSDLFKENYEAQKEYFGIFISKQIREVISDIASLTIFGLADLCTLTCWAGNPFEGIIEQKPTDHPPVTSRVNYMLYYLKKIQSKSTFFKEAVSDVEHSWRNVEKSINLPKSSQYLEFIKKYTEVVEHNFDSIYKFTTEYLMPNPKLFKAKQWDDYVSMYNLNKNGEFTSDCCSDPIDCVIRAWAKRWYIYKTVCEKNNGDFMTFTRWHKNETKIFGQTINELNSWK